jgi:hypothetical protein
MAFMRKKKINGGETEVSGQAEETPADAGEGKPAAHKVLAKSDF